VLPLSRLYLTLHQEANPVDSLKPEHFPSEHEALTYLLLVMAFFLLHFLWDFFFLFYFRTTLRCPSLPACASRPD
jgi:hypothetical protein